MPAEKSVSRVARAVLPAGDDLDATLEFFIGELGFRLESIGPADAPVQALLSGYGLNLQIEQTADGSAGTLRIATTEDPVPPTRTAPNGTRVEFVTAAPPAPVRPAAPRACIRTPESSDSAWRRGRAGMLYRDLVPDRAGGYLIASHIRIPDGGPVPDHVHHHAIGFQFIYCLRGWVRLVYEDQGEPFVLGARDCVSQPPHIRHRVLEASDGLEVVELASPATHETRLDHDMPLPTGRCLPKRVYSGQIFLLHRARETAWEHRAGTPFEKKNTGMMHATGGLADVHVLRAVGTGSPDPGKGIARSGAFTFLFVLAGRMTVRIDGAQPTLLGTHGACLVPAESRLEIPDYSRDLELLEVVCPG